MRCRCLSSCLCLFFFFLKILERFIIPFVMHSLAISYHFLFISLEWDHSFIFLDTNTQKLHTIILFHVSILHHVNQRV